DGYMRRMFFGLLAVTIVAACSNREPNATLAADTTAALGMSSVTDTPTIGTNTAIDTTRAAALRQTTSHITRPAVVYHMTDEQRRLHELRLEKPKTTIRKYEPLKRPATNR
ncbi:MAG: membrane lipoprotein lipid attachment site-containing protein, partial [Gemmatimonadaceae bacterium]